MSVFTTNDAAVLLPRNIADGLVKKSQSTSTIARLSGAEPQRFGETEFITFNDMPRAEFVGEGEQRSATKGGFGSVTAKPHTAHVTMRFSKQVQFLDQERQLGVLNELSDAGAVALSRALDLGLFHRINPLTGETITGWDNYLDKSGSDGAHQIAWTGDADTTLRAAVAALMDADNPVDVSGAALDPRFVAGLVSLPEINGGQPTGRPRYPELGFGTGVASFQGLATAVGNTVAGTPEASDTRVRAIVGDFANRIRWGVQRDLGVEIIRYGDPDGQGDLQRKGQIALRLTLVFGWYVWSPSFAVIRDARPAGQSATPFAGIAMPAVEAPATDVDDVDAAAEADAKPAGKGK